MLSLSSSLTCSTNTLLKVGAITATLATLSGCGSDIAAGGAHTVAYNNGTLYTWGRNTSGQLGNDDLGNHAKTPIAIDLPLPPGADVVDIKANLNFSLLLDSKGDVWAWGTNREGEMGNGNTEQTIGLQKIEALDAPFITDIAAGQRHALAVSYRGKVWAWGNNGAGQLGEEPSGDNPRTDNRLVPEIIEGLNNIIDVEAGGAFSLAINNKGQVLAWGDNDNGQLAQDPNSVDFQARPTVVSGLSKISEIAAGKDHAIALKRNGKLFAWGQNFSGQLGLGTNDDIFTPSPVDTKVKMEHIAASGNFSLAISRKGHLYTWGQNLLGSLGTGLDQDENSPVKIDFFDQPVTNAVNGLGHTIVTTLERDGSEAFWTFGLNSFGQIGIEDAPFQNYTPQRVVFPELD